MQFRPDRRLPIYLNVDVVVAEGLAATPATPARPPELIRLAIVAAAAAVTLGAAAGYGVLLVVQTLADFSDVLPFNGWQVWVVGGVLAAVILAALAVSWRLSRRRYRDVRDRSPHARAVVTAVVPALVLGGLIGNSVGPVLTWASDHTSAAAAARHEVVVWRNALQRGPLAAPTRFSPAPSSMAAQLLSPHDLGADWYAGLQTNPTTRALAQADVRAGAVARAASWLTEQHRNGTLNGLTMWSLDMSVLESVTRMRTHAEALGYLPVVWRENRPCSCPTGASETRTTIHGIPVWESVSPGASVRSVWAVFVVNNRLFTVRSHLWRAAAADVSLTRPVRVAVERTLAQR
jgi:hypothetical protein